MPTQADDNLYLAGFVAGARYVNDIIKCAAARHPSSAGKQTLASLHTILEEGLKQWLKETEAASSTSPNSSTPQ